MERLILKKLALPINIAEEEVEVVVAVAAVVETSKEEIVTLMTGRRDVRTTEHLASEMIARMGAVVVIVIIRRAAEVDVVMIEDLAMTEDLATMTEIKSAKTKTSE